jgi:hypothetical protein
MKLLSLLALTSLALLTNCKKEGTGKPGPTYTLSRSLRMAPSGIVLDTAYSTGQISFRVQTTQPSQHEPDLELYFGSAKTKDQLTLSIPVSKLRPGWVGSYEFRHSITTAPYITGDVREILYFRYNPFNNILFDVFTGVGSLTITHYDEANHLISGQFEFGENGFITFYPISSQQQDYKLIVKSAFDNIPVTP